MYVVQEEIIYKRSIFHNRNLLTSFIKKAVSHNSPSQSTSSSITSVSHDERRRLEEAVEKAGGGCGRAVEFAGGWRRLHGGWTEGGKGW